MIGVKVAPPDEAVSQEMAKIRKSYDGVPPATLVRKENAYSKCPGCGNNFKRRGVTNHMNKCPYLQNAEKNKKIDNMLKEKPAKKTSPKRAPSVDRWLHSRVSGPTKDKKEDRTGA